MWVVYDVCDTKHHVFDKTRSQFLYILGLPSEWLFVFSKRRLVRHKVTTGKHHVICRGIKGRYLFDFPLHVIFGMKSFYSFEFKVFLSCCPAKATEPNLPYYFTHSWNIYLYIYMYLYTYKYIYIYIHAHTHTHTHTHTYIYIYIYR